MAIPDGIKVEIAFTTVPDDPAPSWTDVTAYVDADQGIHITRGRQDEFGVVGTGTCTMTLDNTDGRFTAGYVSGAYYPNVKRMRKLRVTTVAPAAVSSRFTGYVEEWPVSWPGGQAYCEAQITAVDRFARIGNLGELTNIISEEILLDDPAAYYTLGEPTDSVTAGDTSKTGTSVASVAQIGSGGTLAFAASTGPGTDGLSAPLFTRVDTSNGKYLRAPPPSTLSDSASCLECFFSTSSTNAVLVAMTRPDGINAYLMVDATGKLFGYHRAGGITGSTTVTDGATHHAALVYDGSTGITLYLDGVSEGTSAAGVIGSPFDGMCIGGAGPLSIYPMNGTIAHAAFFATALTVARVLAHATAGLTGFSGERSDQRVARYASYAGIPTAEQDLETGLSTSISHYDTTGKGPLAAMQDIAATENGVLQMAGDGRLAFQARSHRYNTAVTLTISGQDIDPSARFVENGLGLINDVTASRPNGITYRSADAASRDDNGVAKRALTLYVTTDNEVIDAADWLAHMNSTATPRLPNLIVDILTNSGIAAAVLGMDVGTRLTLNTLPSQAPAASVDLFVEGWTEAITSQGWRFAINTSPADSSAVWQLDSSVYSVLGVTSRLGY